MKALHIRHLDTVSATTVDTVTSTCASPHEIRSALRSNRLGHVTAWIDALDGLDWETQLLVSNSSDYLNLVAGLYGVRPMARTNDDLLFALAQSFSPEVLLIEEPGLYSTETLRALKATCKLLAGFSSAPHNQSASFASVDLFLSSSADVRNSAIQMGAREAIEFYVGSEYDELAIYSSQERDIDVAFCGTWDNQHTTRNQLLLELSKGALGWHGGFSLSYHIPGDFDLETMPVGVAMHVTSCDRAESVRAVARARIAVYAAPDTQILDVPEDLVFDATSAGTLLLTAPFRGLETFFEPGKEIDVFNSTEEMIKRVRWFLDNESERSVRAAAGQRRYARQHSVKAKMAALSRELLNRL